jgi:hypothetical protein
MAQLNNSSAHRERVFLQDQLQTVRVDMETAEKGAQRVRQQERGDEYQ